MLISQPHWLWEVSGFIKKTTSYGLKEKILACYFLRSTHLWLYNSDIFNPSTTNSFGCVANHPSAANGFPQAQKLIIIIIIITNIIFLSLLISLNYYCCYNTLFRNPYVFCSQLSFPITLFVCFLQLCAPAIYPWLLCCVCPLRSYVYQRRAVSVIGLVAVGSAHK
jgi:hypothetical protein